MSVGEPEVVESGNDQEKLLANGGEEEKVVAALTHSAKPNPCPCLRFKRSNGRDSFPHIKSYGRDST